MRETDFPASAFESAPRSFRPSSTSGTKLFVSEVNPRCLPPFCCPGLYQPASCEMRIRSSNFSAINALIILRIFSSSCFRTTHRIQLDINPASSRVPYESPDPVPPAHAPKQTDLLHSEILQDIHLLPCYRAARRVARNRDTRRLEARPDARKNFSSIGRNSRSLAAVFINPAFTPVPSIPTTISAIIQRANSSSLISAYFTGANSPAHKRPSAPRPAFQSCAPTPR